MKSTNLKLEKAIDSLQDVIHNLVREAHTRGMKEESSKQVNKPSHFQTGGFVNSSTYPKKETPVTPSEVNPLPSEYSPDSPVGLRAERIKRMVDGHWAYLMKELLVGQDPNATFTLSQVMQIRRQEYHSAATHFYGHGYEDCLNDSK